MTRAWSVIAGVGALAFTLTACNIPSPLSRPLQLTPPLDATAEVLAIIGSPAPPAETSTEAARHLATRLTGQHDGCEVFTVAQVVWIRPSEPSAAAIEVNGMCDDSVAGIWYEVTIEGDDQLGWVIATATKQDICRRGVSGTVCL